MSVLLANAVSTIIGGVVFFIKPIQYLPADIIHDIDWYVFNTALTTGLPVAISISIRLLLMILFGIVINTALEYPAYYFYLKDVSKRRLFWVTVLSNILSNAFMVLILLFSLVDLTKKAPYSGRTAIENIYPSESPGEEVISKSGKDARVKTYPLK